MSVTKKRITWIDSSRGIAFLVVIFHHLDLENHIVMRFLAPMFLTIFFFDSGYLFKNNASFKNMLLHRTRTLLWPFFVLGNITILSSIFFSFNEKHIGILESYKELFAQYGYSHINTMWFIPSLYIYSIVFYLMCQIRNGKLKHFAFILLLFLNWYLYYYVFDKTSCPWNLQWTGFACFYMYLGLIYRSNEEKIDIFLKLPICLLLLLLYVGYIVTTNRSCDFYGSPFLVDSFLLPILGVVLLIYMCKRVDIKFLNFVGGNTLLYFALHGKVASFVNVIYRFVFQWEVDVVLWYESILIAKTVMIALLLAPICQIINKKFPFILGRFNDRILKRIENFRI